LWSSDGTLLENLWYDRPRDHHDVHGFCENGVTEKLLRDCEM
jgi:hypothetical protein